ncbi:chemokine XC receptor 1 [Sphaeramia orbicularis]|uniref:chemokine XC receptor 1 n=1 Tax=Sphaeramia orbicularis TaxID=375764 RepID=UPI00117BECB4|nr:chemokine XC receptor 1-like [Sphaeramia orbicularis]
MENNSSVSGGDHLVYLCDWPNFETVIGAIFILIFILSVIGNSLILCILTCYENLNDVTNLFFLNLACSDLVFTITLPFYTVYSLHHWVFGDVACKFLTSAYFVGIYSSVILLTAMTVDRFITVVLNWPRNPVKRRRYAIGACAGAWVISIASSLRDAMAVKVEAFDENTFSCEASSETSENNLDYYLQTSLLFFLPFAIIIFCYSAILKTVLTTANRQRRRTVVVVLCIVAAFFICWGPYNTFILISTLYKPVGCYEEERFYIAYSVCRVLAYSHCCMNALLYMLSQKMRRHLLSLLHCENTRRSIRDRGTGQSSSVIQNAAITAQNSADILELKSN